MTFPVAVVTGACGGIGSALVSRLASDNWRQHLIDVDAAKLIKLQKNLAATSFSESQLESREACEAALPSNGDIDALVHLAGIFVPDDLGSDSRKTYDETMQHNASNAFDLVGAILPRMKKDGRIVLTSSLGFNRGVPDHVAYSMAKGAIVGLTRALSRLAGPLGINVNAVAPGIIETDMTDHLIAKRGSENILQTIPLGRLGQPEDVVGVIAFLLSKDASYITGQVINVDGGIVNG